jgi:hypothetical protein
MIAGDGHAEHAGYYKKRRHFSLRTFMYGNAARSMPCQCTYVWSVLCADKAPSTKKILIL